MATAHEKIKKALFDRGCPIEYAGQIVASGKGLALLYDMQRVEYRLYSDVKQALSEFMNDPSSRSKCRHARSSIMDALCNDNLVYAMTDKWDSYFKTIGWNQFHEVEKTLNGTAYRIVYDCCEARLVPIGIPLDEKDRIAAYMSKDGLYYLTGILYDTCEALDHLDRCLPKILSEPITADKLETARSLVFYASMDIINEPYTDVLSECMSKESARESAKAVFLVLGKLSKYYRAVLSCLERSIVMARKQEARQ